MDAENAPRREEAVAGKERSLKDREMAADLKKRGIWHGRRMTSTNAPTMSFGRLNEVGSNKYRRYIARERKGT